MYIEILQYLLDNVCRLSYAFCVYCSVSIVLFWHLFVTMVAIVACSDTVFQYFYANYVIM